jgi:hypothetical protein
VRCEETTRLATEYEAATSAFSEAVKGTGKSAPLQRKYQRLERISSAARVKPEQARLALEQHISTHRC